MPDWVPSRFEDFAFLFRYLPILRSMELIHAAGITQSLLLSVYFFRQRGKGILEGLLLLTVAATISIGYLYGTHRILEFPHLARWGFTVMSLIGPLFYFSMRAGDRGIGAMDAIWFLVPAGISIYLIPFHLSSADHKLAYLREDLIQIHLDCIIILYASLINNLASMSLGIIQLYRRDRRERENQSSAGSILYYFVPLALLLFTASISAFDPNLLNSGLFSGIGSVIVLLRSYVIVYNQRSDSETDALYPPTQRYRKALLGQELVQECGERLRHYLDNEKPYLEPDFKLQDAAKFLDLSNVQTSQIINRYFGKSFLQMCQELRVSEARALLESRPDSFTILDIALESGFNSKSAFNSAFRNIVGASPSDYRKKLRS